MKKIIFLLLFLIPIKIKALSASSYIVMDYDSGRVLEGSNINTKKMIASTTKIMTCIVALENINPNMEIEVDKDVLKAYGSAIYIEVGERLKIIDLLYGLMLRSGNDAAIEIANNVAGSQENFVILMNNKAKDLGMNNTYFINPHGLEESDNSYNYSTSYDMAILMRYALKNNTFKEIISSKKYIVKTNYKTYSWINKNKLLFQYNNTIGGKTGYTKKAKRTLVTAATKDNKTLIIVTLNDPNDFDNHKKLYESNFKKYELIKVLDKNNFNLKDNNIDGILYIKQDYKMLLTNEENNNIKLEYELNKDKYYKDNDIVGYAKVILNNKEISKIPVFLRKKKVKDKKNNWFQKLIDFLIFWK